jgi:hypothetical protein
VYASLSGASWLDALVRLLAGGGAAPVAAKVAALGVGAAALGSSAVVVPYVFDNHRPARGSLPAPAAVVQARHAAPTKAPPPTRRVVAAVVVAPTPVRVSRHVEGQDGSLTEAKRAPAGADGDRGAQSSPISSVPPGSQLRVESIDGHSGDGAGHGGSDDGGGGSSGPDGGD